MEKRNTLVFALLLSVIGANVLAQEEAGAYSVQTDSVEVDTAALGEESESTLEPEENKARTDSCIQARYAIVSENGKYGIYDGEKKVPVTAIDMDYLQYSHYFHPEEDMHICYFYYEKGLKCGEIGINMNDNMKVDVAGDNPRLVGKEDDYPTLDSLITAKSYDVLRKCMMDIDGIQGQIAVVDAESEQLLSWGALEKGDDGIARAPLLKKFCCLEAYMPFAAADCLAQSNTSLEDSVDTGQGILVVNDSLKIRDHNWQRGGYGMLTYRQALLNKSRIGMFRAMMSLPDGMDYWNCVSAHTKEINVMEMATTFNGIFYSDSMYIGAARQRNIRETAIGMFKDGGIQHEYAPKDVELAGAYNVADDGNEQTFSFVGSFPADKPKYTIGMVVLRKRQLPASSAMLSGTVNGLIGWLNRRADSAKSGKADLRPL